MSRGHGRVERNLLQAAQDGPVLFRAAVARSEQVPLGIFGTATIPRNTYESYRRAMRLLERDGLISVQRRWTPEWDWLIARVEQAGG